MTQNVQTINWQTQSGSRAPVAVVKIDFSTDPVWMINPVGTYPAQSGNPLSAKGITIDNTPNPLGCSVVINGVSYPINPFQRLSVPFSQSAPSVVEVDGTAGNVVTAYLWIDPASTGPDNIDQLAAAFAAFQASFYPTYSAAIVAQAGVNPMTDFFGIIGSAAKQLYVTRFEFSAYAPANTIDLGLFKRSALNTGGAKTLLASVSSMSTDPAANGQPFIWTAAPGVLGAGAPIRAVEAYIPAHFSGPPTVQVWDFVRQGVKPPILANAAESLWLNANAADMSAIHYSASIEWYER